MNTKQAKALAEKTDHDFYKSAHDKKIPEESLRLGHIKKKELELDLMILAQAMATTFFTSPRQGGEVAPNDPDVEELHEELKALDPELQTAFGELFLLQSAPANDEAYAQENTPDTSDNEQSIDSKAEKKAEKLTKQLHCLTLESIMALSKDGALDKSPALKKHLGAHFKKEFGNAKEFEQKINGLLSSGQPEKTTDMLVLVSRLGDLNAEEQKAVQKIAQKAYEEMMQKAATNPRYAFEAKLLADCVPFDLEMHRQWDRNAAATAQPEPGEPAPDIENVASKPQKVAPADTASANNAEPNAA